MNTRSRTIASFFSVAMAAMLLGTVVTTQIQRPRAAQARPAEPGQDASHAPLTLDTFRDVARRVNEGVVNINTSKVVDRRHSKDPFRDFFGDDMMDNFFGQRGGPQRQTQRSLGSGFVIDGDGYVLTNRHVVEDADQIQVTLANQKQYDATLVGRDARTDVALLKIEPNEALTVLPLGDSDATEVAEWVMAIGNPFGLGGNSVTVGVVSYKGRPLNLGTRGTSVDMIQTDASINPGNSGGPLLNTAGEVIGINTIIITRGLPQSAGVGFAVPINVAKEILQQLRERGKVVRGWLGVQIMPVSPDLAKTLKMAEATGAIISDVTAGSPAATAGLEPGDVILSIDGRAMADNNDVARTISTRKPGEKVTVGIAREGAHKTIDVTLGTFPDEEVQQTADAEPTQQLGMTLHELSPELAERMELPRTQRGVVVMDVEAGEPAEEAGLQRFDVIVSVNGVAIDNVAGFGREIDKAREDGLARLRVRRGDSHLFLVLKLR